VIIISPLKRDFLYFSLPSRVFKLWRKEELERYKTTIGRWWQEGGVWGCPAYIEGKKNKNQNQMEHTMRK
jgi:hypothetical protein